jgi:hypothetical protein
LRKTSKIGEKRSFSTSDRFDAVRFFSLDEGGVYLGQWGASTIVVDNSGEMGLQDRSDHTVSSPRLSEALCERHDRTFGSLAALPSNVQAIEAALLFAANLNSLVALVGPSGWGKSHILDAVVHRLSQEPGDRPELSTAIDFVTGSSRTEPQTLVLDDVQEILTKARHRMNLRLVLEKRVRANKPTILAFTQPKVTRQLKALLPSTREWTIATIDVPEPEERILLLNQLAKAEGLSLSPALVRIIALQMHGNGRTLAGATKRLRLAGSHWLDTKATLRACGLLDPFFADNSAWDLKYKILLTADAKRAQFSKALGRDMALFVMLHVAELAESDVARAAGIEPADAYLRANRFAKQAEESSETRAYVAQFVETVVSALATE